MELLRVFYIDEILTLVVIWVSLLFAVSCFIPYHPEIRDYGMVPQKIVRVFSSFFNISLISHQLYLLYTNQGFNRERQIFINLMELSFLIADGFWIFIWHKKRPIDMMLHHLFFFSIISTMLYIDDGFEQTALEYWILEQSAWLSMIRDLLKMYRQQDTKSAIIIEIFHTLSFFLTKMLMRFVLMYYYQFVYKYESNLIYVNYLIQALLLYWGYVMIKVDYSKWKRGYFSYQNFKASPWFIKLKKKE